MALPDPPDVAADHEPIGVLAIGHPAPGGSTGSAWRGGAPWSRWSTGAAGEPDSHCRPCGRSSGDSSVRWGRWRGQRM